MEEIGNILDIPDYELIRKNFTSELQVASRNQKSSIPFIRNPLPSTSLVQPNEKFQVFVIGGTHGATALVQLVENKKFTIIEERLFTPLPIFATKDDFLSFISGNLYNDVTALGINLAYNLTPVTGERGELDGVLNQGDTKGHAFDGLQGEQVGKSIAEYLLDKIGRRIVVTVGNDTVCLIAAGLEEGIARNDLVAAIAGTGYNLAIFFNDTTIINLQASDFTGFTPTATGKLVDQKSKNAGEQLYNKEVAAGELYKHFNVLIETLHLSRAPLETGEELSAVAGVGEGREAELARALFERSASLAAAQLAGIYDFKGKPEKLICIAQGSLFWKEDRYTIHLQKRLASLGLPGHAIDFRLLEKADILGAIKLVIV